MHISVYKAVSVYPNASWQLVCVLFTIENILSYLSVVINIAPYSILHISHCRLS